MKNENLSWSQRLNRIAFGAALIVFTMLVNALPLGLYALLPLLATYPIFSGIYGNDPVKRFARQGVLSVAHAAAEHLHIGVHRSRHS